MIFLENNPGKIFLMVFLVIIFFATIFWQWWEFNPLKRAYTGQPSEAWTDVIDEGSKTLDIVGTDLEIGLDKISEFPEDFARQQKQQELLDSTQEYLDNKATSTDDGDTNNDDEE
ncbi:hypothetical protein HON36_00240 [Candidatus Parcubacteria bacterium]|jgi:hypothetical protein|nr:hypothetical protein [Candidatus Parcubacteria bacterium]MBT7228413.1 hypothetical protein [Candidatus Parcubacteria bacterium]